jgi:CubicO group peptidase (beta-lactamase class C family)
MFNIVHRALGLLLIVVSGYATAQPRNENSFRINGRVINIARFDAEINSMIVDAGIPAISLALMEGDRVVYAKSYGIKQLSKKNKVNPETVFEACSLSKSFMVYMAYKLAEEGKLDLDRPIHEYLEPGPMLDHDPRYKKITTRMILSHSSGLEDWPFDNDPAKMDMLSAPGEKFHYSSLGYNYLGATIEAIMKKPYDQYIPEMVMTPLKLKNTFTRFRFDSVRNQEIPADYAVGHDAFDKEFDKWKNTEGLPSSGISTTAVEYAQLIVALMDGKHLSAASVQQILAPMMRTSTDDQGYYYGTGFELLCTPKDTIIGHGGSNPGFKGQLFYSPRQKRGFVFLTNSNQGKLLTTRINEMTVNLDINRYYAQFSVDQYPGKSTSLLQLYKHKGATALFTEINKSKKSGQLIENTLNQLGKNFFDHDTVIARRLLEKNISYFPRSSYAHLLLGDLNKRTEHYEAALRMYQRAQQLGFKLWDIDTDLKECNDKIKEINTRKAFVTTVHEQAVIQAEDFNDMRGVRLEPTGDEGGGKNVGFADPGDWLDYTVDIAKTGNYKVAFRIANDMPNSTIALGLGNNLLTILPVVPTRGWQQWSTQEAMLHLKAGKQTLRLTFPAGATNVNWFQLMYQQP